MNAPNSHGTWEQRTSDDGRGYPHPPFVQCSYCGSISPDQFLASVRAGHKIGGSDWKYGFPHKFYVDVPNPNPAEQRVFGSTIEDGKETDLQYGTCQTIPCKFYTEHLEGWEPLRDTVVQDEIEQATGIRFLIGEDGKLMYRAPHHGYQR